MFWATCQPVEPRHSPSFRLYPIPSVLIGEEWKMLCPAVVFWDPLWQAGNVPGPSYPAQKSVQQWRPAARAHVHRPLGGLIEGMISRRGAMISLPRHAQNRFSGRSGERKGRCENWSLEKSHSSMWPVDVLDYFKHTNQSQHYCTLQAQADKRLTGGLRSEDCGGEAWAVPQKAIPAVGRIPHLLLHSHTPFNAGDTADSWGAQQDSTLLVSISTITATTNKLFFQEAELVYWAKIYLIFPDLFKVAALAELTVFQVSQFKRI